MYLDAAAYGHMGRKSETVTRSFTNGEGETKSMTFETFTWEKLDYIDKVKAAFAL